MLLLTISIKFILNFQLNFQKGKTVLIYQNISFILSFQKNSQQKILLFRDDIHSLFFGKSERLFQNVSTKIYEKSFIIFPFFPSQNFFRDTKKVRPGYEIHQFFMNKKVCISANGKVT